LGAEIMSSAHICKTCENEPVDGEWRRCDVCIGEERLHCAAMLRTTPDRPCWGGTRFLADEGRDESGEQTGTWTCVAHEGEFLGHGYLARGRT
jgi:hypothetical protein